MISPILAFINYNKIQKIITFTTIYKNNPLYGIMKNKVDILNMKPNLTVSNQMLSFYNCTKVSFDKISSNEKSYTWHIKYLNLLILKWIPIWRTGTQFAF